MADVTKPARRGRARAQEQVSDRARDVEERAPDVEETAKDAKGQASEAEGHAPDVEETAHDAREQASDAQPREERGGGEPGDGARATVTSELKDTIREAAIEVLKPVARQATKSAAKYAVTKGPGLVKDKVVPKVEEAGGAGALAKGALAKGGAAGGGIGSAVGGLAQKIGRRDRGDEESPARRRLPVQEHVDEGADIQTVYDQFTQFEDFPEFAQNVEKV
jgi:hypothetical protein